MSLFLWLTIAKISQKKPIFNIEHSVFFLNAVVGPSHSICQFGFKVFILLARKQIKGIMDRTESGFC